MDPATHADNTVHSDSCLLIHNTGRKVDVSGFSTALGSIELPIILGAVTYDHPTTGKVYRSGVAHSFVMLKAFF